MAQTAADEDLYKLVSGFYGPGSMGCWYLLVASVFISWVFDPRYRFCVTNDIIAAVAYPTIAAGHLIIQIVKFPKSGVQYMVRIWNMFDLIGVPAYNVLPKLGEKSSAYGQYPADLSSMTEVYPRGASINASLRVVDNFAYLALVLLFYSLPKKNYTNAQLRHRPSLLLIIGGSLILSWAAELMLVIKICTSAAHGKSEAFSLHFGMRIFWVAGVVYLLLVLFFAIWIVIVATENILRIYRHSDRWQEIRQIWGNWTRRTQSIRDRDNHPEFPSALETFPNPASIFLASLGGMVILGVYLFFFFPRLLLFPPAGSTLMELDQAAALVGGLFNLGLTFLSILRQFQGATM